MDWAFAIRLNRDALRAAAAAVAALIGGGGSGPIARRLRNAALALLRPAEAAARRLIVIAARGLPVPAPRPAPAFASSAIPTASPGDGTRAPAFRLVDPPRPIPPPRFAPRLLGSPRIRSFWTPATPLVPLIQTAALPPAPPQTDARPPNPAALVDAGRLHLRLAALSHALDDLPRQARRLLRWRARAGRCRDDAADSGIPSHRTPSPAARNC